MVGLVDMVGHDSTMEQSDSAMSVVSVNVQMSVRISSDNPRTDVLTVMPDMHGSSEENILGLVSGNTGLIDKVSQRE